MRLSLPNRKHLAIATTETVANKIKSRGRADEASPGVLLFVDLLDTLRSLDLWAAAFFAVLFLQSGFDKIFDRAGNLSWMVPHFEKSPFKGLVPTLLSVLTLMEIAAGLLCAATVVLLFFGQDHLAGWAAGAVSLTFVMLFAGQRLAKDYAGAASLAAYFAVAAVWLGFSGS